MFRQAVIAGFIASLALLPAIADAKSRGEQDGGNDHGQSYGKHNDKDDDQGNNKDDGHGNDKDHGGQGGGMPGGIGGGGNGGGPTAQASEPIVLLVLGTGLIGAVVLRRRN